MAKKKKPSKAALPSRKFDELTFNREEQYKKKLDAILKTATYCLNELGYSGTSLRTLAAQMKITDSALYHYVRSKDELASLCYMRTLDFSDRAQKRADEEGKTGLEKLQLYIRYQVVNTCGSDGPTATLSDLPSIRMAQRLLILERIDRAHKTVIGFFETGFKDKTIVRCIAVDAALVIWGAMTFLAKWNDRHGKYDVDELADTYVQVLTSGVAAR